MSASLKRLARYPADQILPFVGSGCPKKTFDVDGIAYKVAMNAKRFKVFKKCLYCVRCGMTGNYFFLEQHIDAMVPHLSLYNIDVNGKLTIMTIDHIIPSSKGGKNRICNLQTMCRPCNNQKSDDIPDDIMLSGVPKKLLGAMFYLCANY
ncbi:MAG TPA: HNH endonuclease [Anaerovoracaceae bacterium]|nr:HNH endonuclease [Anaerovoracaceae bacterium]